MIIWGTGIILWIMGWKKGIKITGWVATGYAIITVIGVSIKISEYFKIIHPSYVI
ncbi:hypothetical protein [Clostridium sp. ZS2-4]|uniref:hypothetical protein n=1 Tax=Clostridium sp. ZS2-4 TaxID=2987703 RepID=UPI00227B80DC|nr:hypothetical protein [Clostridium sp. ZS2-4]MCY6354877.1 hypothetical protein [Clostridium sp. ZS2-4]